MIYSDEINRVCGLCQYADETDDAEKMYCRAKRRGVSVTDTSCRKFKYDILKRTAKRRKKLKTYSLADFELT